MKKTSVESDFTLPYAFTAFQMRHALMPGQSILLSVKLDYGLSGTNQPASSYPRDYTDIANTIGFDQPSFAGTEVSGSATGLLVAYAKLVGTR